MTTKPTLQNRFNDWSPNSITSNGTTVSTPIYITCTNAELKRLLNQFRTIKQAQLAEMGYEELSRSRYGTEVTDNTAKPLLLSS